MLCEREQDMLKDLNVCMSLRKPQREALAVFADVIDLLEWKKGVELTTQLDRVRSKFLTVTNFEREFPSVCFALATGVGKTRLMAAAIAYLHRVRWANNFFIVAPNKTIYEKLKRDFSPAYPKKYVFSGLYDFVSPPRIIDGDNFNQNFQTGHDGGRQALLVQQDLGFSPVTFHIFNIAKFTHGRGKDAELARVMRLHEILGQSYFDYLRSLPDLCVMMDESHHYHAEQGFGVINDLNPVIGAEFTATPQIQTGGGKVGFKNVVYEYSLAHALNDGMYVKVPVVWTRRDFDAGQYDDDRLDREKLIDGIKLHIDTKAKLDVYARNHGKKFVKPFVLVVAKDIAHSCKIRDFLTSEDFYEGYYADKVLEINSKQGKVESDENTELLLSLEQPDNRIEIVIHVDKLKEGWDVTNLYTIVPLRASASETLTEQTIGRGLRLPYGERTGVDEVDRLSIVSHDKYQAIIALANDPNSIVRKVFYIDPSLVPDTGSAETEIVELKPAYEAQISSNNFIHEISMALDSCIPEETRMGVASLVAEKAGRYATDMSRMVRSFNDVRTDTESKKAIANQIIRDVEAVFSEQQIGKEVLRKVAENAIEYCAEKLTGTVIPIPEAVISPQSVSNYRIDDFDLDTRNLNLRPSDDAMIGRELPEGGRQVEFDGDYIELLAKPADTPEQDVAKYIIIKDNIDYQKCGKLILSLIAQAEKHFLSYLTAEDTDKVMRQQARNIAEYIYAQMNEHFHESDVEYIADEIRPFSRIEGSFGSKIKADAIYDYNVTVRKGEVSQKVFKGFNKACHTLYKFDSSSELEFARVLEQDSGVLKWLRPASRQFNIHWGKHRQNYEPDFIVETAGKIYMCEVKAAKETQSDEVQEKGRAGAEYCRTVSGWNEENGGKPWEYAIVADKSIQANSSFKYLIDTRTPLEILMDGG